MFEASPKGVEGSSFQGFGKISRLLSMPMLITEKIDGTNAQVYIDYVSKITHEDFGYILSDIQSIHEDPLCIIAGSRNRYITPASDNYGFARWVQANAQEFLKLGPGRHFGEWWGQGLNKNYGLKEKRFSLFNTGRWSNPETRPACCLTVPVLHYGQFSQNDIEQIKCKLKETGSIAAPGFMDPEGIVVFLPKANVLFKSTFEGDDLPKGMTN